MAGCAEIPQCCVCQEPFRKNIRLVRPAMCGHVLCEPCSDQMKNLLHKCPFHCPIPQYAGYEPVFMDFGVHDVVAAGLLDAESSYPLSAESCDILAVEVQTVGRLFGEVAKCCSESWSSLGESTNQKGLVFLRAGRLLHRIGDRVQGSEDVKEFLHRLATALGDLKNLYDSMSDMIQGNKSVRNKLEEMHGALRDELERTRKTLRDKETWYTGRLDSQKLAHTEREEKLRADLSSMYTKWKNEQTRRMAAEDTVTKLSNERDQWRNDSAKFMKKYQLQKTENEKLREETGISGQDRRTSRSRGNVAQHDDSLEIGNGNVGSENIAADDDGDSDSMPPPSSASLEANSALHTLPSHQADSSCRVSNGRTNSDPLPSSSTNAESLTDVHRRLERAHSVGAVRFSSGRGADIPRPMADKPASARDSMHSSSRTLLRSQKTSTQHRASSSSSAPKIKPKVESSPIEPAVDPDLLEICPDLLNELNSNDRLETTDDRHRNGRTSKAGSVPTNPLAARKNSQSLHGPERKKQRLTLGIGGG